jgi:hypothetical protein
MKKTLAVVGLVGLGVFANACTAYNQGDDLKPTEVRAAAKDSPMLNLSHIECTADGHVNAHFVLLFAGSATPGAITGTYNGGSFGPVLADKSSGNVWHYNVPLPAGEIDILSATVVAKGQVVTLHNPSEYAGDYECGPEKPECSVAVAAQDLLCTDQPLKNPGSECGYFGLKPSGKDDGLTGLTHVASQNALLVIVKSGSGGCAPGQSAYRVYTNVHAGDVLSTPADQNISHVTYCECPE